MRAIMCLVLLLAVAACSRDDDAGVLSGTQEPFVAEDAGQIPLTSPGTPTQTERPVVGVLIPADEIPSAVFEEPLPPFPDTTADTALQPRPVAPLPRQQRRSDTLLLDTAPDATVPLVTPRVDTTRRTPAPPTGDSPGGSASADGPSGVSGGDLQAAEPS